MPRKTKGKLCERFYCVDKARRRDQKGAGLGHSIAPWIVTEHPRSTTVGNQPGCGATFRVELPPMAAPLHNSLCA
ncbi:MAG TPA: hypothetical protein VEK33_05240 [Terriglobales bacterium]|nr:hypothetical protein [Terriglobales bacterium]